MKKLKAAIVGCGNIAGDLDLGRDDYLRHPFTHAGAYQADGRYEITACVDSNQHKLAEFAFAWNIPEQYQSLSDFTENATVDVISVCSPTDTHLDVLYKILEMQDKPKVIFCEKPISLNYKGSEAFVKKCQNNGVILAVNYTRRWDPVVINFKENIEQGNYGDLLAINGVYNKGLFNNGSHILDLINYLFSTPKAIFSSVPRYDFFDDDPSISANLRLGNADISIVATDARQYSLFEMNFFFANAQVSMKESGFSWHFQDVIANENMRGYKKLSDGKTITTGYVMAMRNSMDNIYRAVKEGVSLSSDGFSALSAQKLCHEIQALSISELNTTEMYCDSSN